MNEHCTSVSGSLGSTNRSKDWNELTEVEKMERMRGIVKNIQSSLNWQSKEIASLRKKLARHEHREGKVVEIRDVHEYELSDACCVEPGLTNNYF